MNLATLCNLLSTFTDTKQHLEAAALTTSDTVLRTDLERHAHKVAIIVTDLRGEVLARESASGRSTNSAAQEFEAHLHRVLKTYAPMEPARGEAMRQTA